MAESENRLSLDVRHWGDEKLELPLVSIRPGIVARSGGEIPVPPYVRTGDTIPFPPCEQRFFRPCFLAFQMACIYQLSFANGIATDRVSNQIW
ncbi:MAG: hypothetical protein ABSH35_02175, partial [Isosphaeraceae bacterium]